jgi:hypothetical protein
MTATRVATAKQRHLRHLRRRHRFGLCATIKI